MLGSLVLPLSTPESFSATLFWVIGFFSILSIGFHFYEVSKSEQRRSAGFFALVVMILIYVVAVVLPILG